MDTRKSKRPWTRRSRTSLDSAPPKVVTEQPASLRDDTSPGSNPSLNKIREALLDHETLTMVDCLPLDHPRVKHVRDCIESGMPLLNQLSNNASSSSQITLTRRVAERVLSSHSLGDRASKQLSNVSANPPPTVKTHAPRSQRSVKLAKDVSSQTRSIRPISEPKSNPLPPPAPLLPNVNGVEPQISTHQAAMLKAVHHVLSAGVCQDMSCCWSDAPMAVSPEELLSLTETPPEPIPTTFAPHPTSIHTGAALHGVQGLWH